MASLGVSFGCFLLLEFEPGRENPFMNRRKFLSSGVVGLSRVSARIRCGAITAGRTGKCRFEIAV